MNTIAKNESVTLWERVWDFVPDPLLGMDFKAQVEAATNRVKDQILSRWIYPPDHHLHNATYKRTDWLSRYELEKLLENLWQWSYIRVTVFDAKARFNFDIKEKNPELNDNSPITLTVEKYTKTENKTSDARISVSAAYNWIELERKTMFASLFSAYYYDYKTEIESSWIMFQTGDNINPLYQCFSQPKPNSQWRN